MATYDDDESKKKSIGFGQTGVRGEAVLDFWRSGWEEVDVP